MYEVHGWFCLSESPEEGDIGGLAHAVRQIESMIVERRYDSMALSVRPFNGIYYLTVSGGMNRRREEGILIDDLLEFVRQTLPGSYGLLYERDDETLEPPGANSFRVTVLARGRLEVKTDPFLSPCDPVIEA